jgi:hypothetical protein
MQRGTLLQSGLIVQGSYYYILAVNILKLSKCYNLRSPAERDPTECVSEGTVTIYIEE